LANYFQVKETVEKLRAYRKKLCEILSIVGSSLTPAATISPAAPTPKSADLNGEWPVFAVGTTLSFSELGETEHITILVRVPAAGSAKFWVWMCQKAGLFCSPVTGLKTNFYTHPSPAFKFQPLPGRTEVIKGLAWLTLIKPPCFRQGFVSEFSLCGSGSGSGYGVLKINADPDADSDPGLNFNIIK